VSLRHAAAIAFAALSAAAGPNSARLDDDDARRIHTVAVISDVGHSFQFEHVRDRSGEWFGPPDAHFLEVSDWDLDTRITEDLSAALAARFAVRTVAFVPADFSSWDYSLLRSATLNLNADPAIDAYVLVLRDWRGDEIGGSVHDVGGLGLYRRDRARHAIAVYACYRIVVVDALSGQTLASRAALMPDGTLPWLPVGASLWPRTQNDLTAVQAATLARLETRLIDATLLPTAAALGLAPPPQKTAEYVLPSYQGAKQGK